MKLLLILLLLAPAAAAQNLLVGFKVGERPRLVPQLIREIGDLNVYLVRRQALAGLQHNPQVEFIEDDAIAYPALVPDDPLYGGLNAWSLVNIHAAEAWNITTGSSAITIAILDSGLDSAHPDITANAVPGWNVFDNNSDTAPVTTHGTQVAGAAAAVTNNGVGVAAPCWNCKLMPIRVTDQFGFSSYSLLADGLNEARARGVKVANISFYAPYSKTLLRAEKSYFQAGGVITRAEGNDGLQETLPDDIYVLDVGATDQSDVIFSWSNYGTNVDIVAPGVTYSTCTGGVYCTGAGTSGSAPQVAAAAALVWSINPTFTPTQVMNKLKSSANDLGAAGYDIIYGWGRLNLFRAVQ